jgi:hypothetical protein
MTKTLAFASRPAIYIIRASDRVGYGWRAVSEDGWEGPVRSSHSMACGDAAEHARFEA